MPLEISGVVARLRWSYAEAATLSAWKTIRHDDGRWSMTATVVTTNAFRVSQRPLTFEAPHAKGVWRWPVLELQFGEGAVTATLGPIEG